MAPCPGSVIDVLERQAHLLRTRSAPRFPTRRRNPGERNRYGLAALTREASLVRAAVSGTRNETLNLAAFRLGQLIGPGVIEREVVEEVLFEAASRAGLGEWEIHRTIRSGIEAGQKHPRSVGSPDSKPVFHHDESRQDGHERGQEPGEARPGNRIEPRR
jgi:hypothetical protein